MVNEIKYNIKNNNIMKEIITAFFLIVSTVCYSADNFVNDICFNGLKRLSPEVALFYFPIKIGNIINNNVIADSIKVLFSTGYFEDIKIFYDDVGIVTIQVKEYPVINNISFVGNKIIKDDMINKILDSKNIQLGKSINNFSIFETECELRDMYYNIGKFNATVEITMLSLSRNRADLKITIKEEKTAKVGKINLIGNHLFHKKKLLSKFKLCDKPNWWDISSNTQYQTQKLFCDLEILRNFYLNRGYAQFNINSVQINFSPDKNRVYLFLYITEGEKYSFSSVKFHGNILNIIPDIEDRVHIFSGELYSNKKIKDMEREIYSILGKYGYIRPSISIEPEINEKNKTIKLYVYVDAGNRYCVREIYFEGNNVTKDLVIRREISQIEKNYLNYNCVLKDQEKLKNFVYFKNVNAHIKYLFDTLNQVDLVYQVEECNSGNLTLSMGVGTESGANIQFGMFQENLFGTGNSISITGTNNHYQTYIEISAIQSCCNVNKMSIGGKIFYNNMHAHDIDLSNYSLRNYGINYNCAYPIFEYQKFNIGLNYIFNHLSKIAPQIAICRYLLSTNIYPDLIINRFLNENINFSAQDFILMLGWTFNNLNHPYFPTTGSMFNISGKLTLPSSDNQYYKITVDGHHYLSLDENFNWILMTSLYFGYAGSIYNKENPFYDNFYAGGINTVRGFRLNSIGPKAAYYYCNKQDKNYEMCSVKNSQDSVGGNAVSLFKMELIVPIIYVDKQYSDVTRIAVFIDAGNVWDSFWKNTEITRAAGIMDYSIPNNIRISSGVSLKWISPIGPVIFSYSKVMKKYLGDIEEPFQFSIGKIW